MKENKVYFKKGFYNQKQIEGFPTLKQFILVERGGKRCLLLRFANETELTVDGMKFELTQFNATGEVVSKSKVEYTNMRFCPEQTYAAQRGIVVKDNCVDFRIDIIHVVSNKYKYVPRHGQAVATYDIRGYDSFSSASHRHATRKIKTTGIRPAVYRLVAALSLVLVILSCCFVFFRKSDEDGGMFGLADAVIAEENYIL